MNSIEHQDYEQMGRKRAELEEIGELQEQERKDKRKRTGSLSFNVKFKEMRSHPGFKCRKNRKSMLMMQGCSKRVEDTEHLRVISIEE